jgi:hypothetical protein
MANVPSPDDALDPTKHVIGWPFSHEQYNRPIFSRQRSSALL